MSSPSFLFSTSSAFFSLLPSSSPLLQLRSPSFLLSTSSASFSSSSKSSFFCFWFVILFLPHFNTARNSTFPSIISAISSLFVTDILLPLILDRLHAHHRWLLAMHTDTAATCAWASSTAPSASASACLFFAYAAS